MERVFEVGWVGILVVVEPGNKVGEGVVIDFDHFVFSLVDGATTFVFVAVSHGVANGEAAHELADTRFCAAYLFSEKEMKVTGEEDKCVKNAGEFTLMNASTLFGCQSLGGEAGDPRKGGAVGEAEIVGEGDDETFVVGGIFKERLI